jgi:hypothetical protein
MNVDIHGKSAFPEINSHRERLVKQMEKLEKEGKQGSRKYKRAAMSLQKLQLMNFVAPSGECHYSPEEFSKTASENLTPVDAYLIGYSVGGCIDAQQQKTASKEITPTDAYLACYCLISKLNKC